MLRIDSIEPTAIFSRGKHELLQLVNIVIENTSGTVQANLGGGFRVGGATIAGLVPSVARVVDDGKFAFGASADAGIALEIERGKKTYQIYVPDIREAVPAEFVLKVNEQVQDQKSMDWTPRKHWQVHMIPIAHHDLGYTDTIEGVLRKYCRIYEDVLRFCDETADWPEEAKFRYMAEEAWSIQHFIQNSSEKTLEKLEK